MSPSDAVHLLSPTLLFAAPVLVASTGELVVERAGIINIGIEGMMLAGALAGWVAAAHLGAAAGIGAAMLAAMALGCLFAAAVLIFSADQIVAGTGINMLSLGLTGMIYKEVSGPASALKAHQLSPWIVVALTPLLGLVVWAYFRFTRAGLEHAAIGESPEAADSAGVSVQLRKLGAILFGAACAGLAGAYLSTMRVWAFTENMTDGMGFLALAIVIFGRWSAWGILLAGLFFGLVRAGVDALNVSRFARADLENLFNMLPYALSLAALAGLAGRSPAPAALGKVWAR